MSSNKKIIIIGAGVAGISAAMNLANNGYDIVIYESRNFIGGRAYSFKDNVTGESIDNGQHLLVGAYTNYFDIIKKLGTFNLLKEQERLKVVFIDKTGYKDILDTSLFGGKFGLMAGLFRMKKISIKSKLQLVNFFRKLNNGNIIPQELTVNELFTFEHQGSDSIRRFWQPLCLAVLNSNIEKAPASLLLNVLKKAFFSSKESSKIYFPAVGLSTLLEPFPTWAVYNGIEINFQQSVKQIIIDNNKVTGIMLDGDKYVSCDAVISSVQPSVFKKMLPLSYTENPFFGILNEIQYSTIISIYLWLDREIIQDEFAATIGTTTHWIFNRRLICSVNPEIFSKYPSHLALTISGANLIAGLTSEELLNICMRDIRSCIPAAKEAKILHYRVIKDKHATFQATPEIESLRPKAKTPIGNLFLAGDWTATGLPATIEGAAVSGRNAADEAIKG